MVWMRVTGFSLVLLAAAGLVVAQTAADEASEEAWHQAPFRIRVGAHLLDTSEPLQDGGADERVNQYNKQGHAGPALADVDGNGIRDLVVGTYSGQFRFHKNMGTNEEPRFSERYTWLQSGDRPAAVSIWCCVASSPTIIDLDGDGINDLVSGAYDNTVVYWFRGVGDGRFADRQMLTDAYGIPIHIGSPGEALLDTGLDPVRSMAGFPTFGDVTGDGRSDLVLGNAAGEIHLLPHMVEDFTSGRPAITVTSGQPVFGFGFAPISEEVARFRGSVRKYGDADTMYNLTDFDRQHAAPAIADWDGDGLLDLIGGAYSGAVYLFRNVGDVENPKYSRDGEQLLPPGIGGYQWENEDGDAPERGIRAQIQVVDYNLDGKIDLLVGDWSNTIAPRTSLTSEERDRLQAIEQELKALDQQVGYAGVMPRYKDRTYVTENKALWERAEALEKERGRFLESNSLLGGEDRIRWQSHGYIWVYLRK